VIEQLQVSSWRWKQVAGVSQVQACWRPPAPVSDDETLTRHLLHRTIPTAGCTLVAVLVPSVWKPLKLLGGTAGTFGLWVYVWV